MKKQCVLILPYFGKFNNYFPLFLRSCGANPSYDFLIFTDSTESYQYPSNVHVVPMTLEEFKAKAKEKIGFDVCIPKPYKLCDFKPAYGFLFEDYIQDYEYWGHCDCDLVFGDLETLLTPILKAGYDKIFAAGHLTLYRNTAENNRRFMKPLRGREIYKEAFTTNKIYVFDENVQCWMNPDRLNVHVLFREDGAKLYEKDLSFNVATSNARIERTIYDPDTQSFHVDASRDLARYYWCDKGIVSVSWDRNKLTTVIRPYLYMHLQSRRMHGVVPVSSIVEIRPDRFVAVNRLPVSKNELGGRWFNVFNLFWIDTYFKKIQKKINNLMKAKQ